MTRRTFIFFVFTRFNYSTNYSLAENVWVFVFCGSKIHSLSREDQVLRFVDRDSTFIPLLMYRNFLHRNTDVAFGFFKFQFQPPGEGAFGFKCEFPRCRATHFFPRHLVNTFSLPHFLDALVYPLDRRSIYLTADFRGTNEDHPFFTTFLSPPLSPLPSPRKSNRFHIRARISIG